MKKISEATEARDKKVESFLALNEGEAKVHFIEPQVGQFGMLVVIESPAADMLAKILNIPNGWVLTPVKIGTGKNSSFAAYNEGDRLTFFESERDYAPDEAKAKS